MHRNIMPQLYRVFDSIHENEFDFSAICVIACQHLLISNFEYFNLLYKLGLKPNQTFILGKTYSASNTVFELWKETGAHVSDNSFKFDSHTSWSEQFDRIIQSFLDQEVIPNIQSHITKFIIVDDGGFLIEAIQNHSFFGGKEIIGVEQTSSGFRRLNSKLRMPVVNVARTNLKLDKESPYIAEYCLQETMTRIKDQSIKDVLILGNGYIAKSLQNECIKTNLNVTIFETLGKSSEQIGAEVIASNADMVFGTVGEGILHINDLPNLLNKKVIFVSCSSGDAEFYAWEFRKQFPVNFDIHADYEQGNIKLLNSGFPVNFNGMPQLIPLEKIDVTEALLFSAVLTALGLKTYASGYIDINEKYIASLL